MAFKGYDFIDEATLEMMGNTLTEQIDFLLQQEIQPNEDDARIAARIFLETIQKSFQAWEEAERHASEIRKYSKAIKDLKTATKDDIVNFNMAKNKMLALRKNINLIEMDVAMENFQKELTKLMGKKIQLTYVYVNRKGEPSIFLIDNIEDVLVQDVKAMSKGGNVSTRIRMTAKQIKQNQQNYERSIVKLNEYQFMLPPALINLQDARLTVLTRYKTYHYGSNHIILWKPEQEWKITIMGNQKGDIEEAYVSALIHRVGFLNDSLEKNIDEFMEYVSQVDAAPGLLEGDVSKDGQKIEYAVKSGKAQNMSLKTAVEVAITILGSKQIFDKNKLNDLKEKIKKGIKPRNQSALASQVEEQLKDIVGAKYKTILKID